MPIYDYRCNDCEQVFDLLVRTSDVPVCPACGSSQLHKLLSVPAPTPNASGADSCAPGGCMPSCASGACPFE